jgi:antibiotic biosynthesis monooxygenase (ABM) superfamily enzyme
VHILPGLGKGPSQEGRESIVHDSRTEDPSDVVTVVVTRDVLPGRERDYEEWTHRIIYDAVPFGSLGAAVITPEGNTPGRRIVVHRFANEETQKAWEESEERKALLREAEHCSVPHYQRATGLETRFALPDERAIVPSPRWKMLLATFLGAYPLVVLLSAFVLPRVPHCSDLLLWVALDLRANARVARHHPLAQRRARRTGAVTLREVPGHLAAPR